MNGIGQHELEEALAARAESLTPGTAPADAVLAGARRRGVRRRAAMATAGVLVVTGAAVEVGSLSRGTSGGAVNPGGPSSNATATRSATPSGPPRHVPVVTQLAGLAPGQKPMADGTVVASGTVDENPWQLVVTDVPIVATGGYHWTITLYTGGKDEASYWGDSQVKGEIAAATLFQAENRTAEIVAIVNPDVAKVVWTGPGGFHQEAASIPIGFGGRSVVVFPDSLRMVYGDTLVAYDASGKKIQTLEQWQPDPGPGPGQSSSMGSPNG